MGHSLARAMCRRALFAALAAGALVVGGAAPLHPSTVGLDCSQSGRLLAFWCDSGLYCADLVQGGVMRLTSASTPGRCSPDGTRVAWGDPSGIYVRQLDSTGAARIAEAGRVAGWRPDSAWVLIESSPPEHAPEIYAASADGRGIIPLAPHPAWDGEAACSPDGRWVAFVSRRDAERSDVWVVGWDGSHLTRVTAMFEASDPTWSPDGAKLALCARAAASLPLQVYSLDFGTSKLTTVSTPEDGDCRSPIFIGPDHLAYTGHRRQLVNLRTGARRELPAGEPAPDGRLLAVLSERLGSLNLVALDGSGRRSLDKAVEAYAWSPDGRWLAYLARAVGPAGLPVRELRINTFDSRGVVALWSEGLSRPGKP